MVINYDRLLKRIKHKYAIPIAASRRAEELEDFGRPKIEQRVAKELGDYVSIALKELEDGVIRIRNEEMLRILLPKVD